MAIAAALPPVTAQPAALVRAVLILSLDRELAQIIATTLRQAGHGSLHAGDDTRARAATLSMLPDAVFLDDSWPDTGVSRQLVQELVVTHRIPCLYAASASMLASHRWPELVQTVHKPLTSQRLAEALETMLGVAHAATEASQSLTVGPVTVELAAHRVVIEQDSGPAVPLELGELQYRLLLLLMSHSEEALTRQTLHDQIWGSDAMIDERTVDVHVKRLRERLRAAGVDYLLQTVRGIGYRISLRPPASSYNPRKQLTVGRSGAA